MKEIDRLIRQALKEEDAQLYESIAGEQPMFDAAMDLLRGRSRWLTAITIVVMIVMVAAAVFSAIQFYEAPQLREMIIWGAVCFFCLMGVTALKIWAWMEMSKNAVTREIKRLELQVAHLANAVAEITDLKSSDS